MRSSVLKCIGFEKIWGEYCKEKEYEKKFAENTEQLVEFLLRTIDQNAEKV